MSSKRAKQMLAAQSAQRSASPRSTRQACDAAEGGRASMSSR
jgi:hypothetical protein